MGFSKRVAIDVSGTFYCCQAAAREMVKRRYGRIVTLASTAVFLAGEAASYVTGYVLAVDGRFLAAGVMHERT